jgi:site-specific DNA-methyltransferase (adenine-specific)
MLKAGGKQDWQTPDWLFNQLHLTYNFKLDAAASDQNAKCEQYYTVDTDGLKQSWERWTFCNPPFSHIKQWVKKAVVEQEQGKYSVVVAPMLGMTAGWYKEVRQYCKTIVLSPRVAFVGDEKQSPNGGTMLLEFGIDGLGTIEFKDISSWKETKKKEGKVRRFIRSVKDAVNGFKGVR